MRILLQISLVLLSTVTFACSQLTEPTATESIPRQPTFERLKEQVDSLLRKMTSERFDGREEASEGLLELLLETQESPRLCAYLQTRYEEDDEVEVKVRIGRVLDLYLLKRADVKKLFKVYGPGYITAVAMNPLTDVFASAHTSHDLKKNTIALWNLAKGEITQKLNHDEEYIESIAYSPDGKLIASGSNSKTVRIWDVSKGKCIHVLKGHEKSVFSLAFSNDSKLLASGDANGVVRIWNVSSGDCMHTLLGHENIVHLLAFSHNGKKLATAGWDGKVCLWATDTGECLGTHAGDKICALAFSPDAFLLVAAGADEQFIDNDDNELVLCSEGRVFLLDANNGNCLHTLKASSSVQRQVHFRSDNRRLLWTGGDLAIALWDTQTGQRLRVLTEPSLQVKAFAFGTDDTFLISGDHSGTVRLWNPFTGRCIKTLYKHEPMLISLLLSHGGKFIVCYDETEIIILGIQSEK